MKPAATPVIIIINTTRILMQPIDVPAIGNAFLQSFLKMPNMPSNIDIKERKITKIKDNGAQEKTIVVKIPLP